MKKKILVLTSLVSVALLCFIGFKWYSPNTKIIAHRGASGYKMEHTFQAYDLAKKSTPYIEQDAVLSKDNTLYVSHDLTPYRVTKTEKRPFRQLTDAEINRLKTRSTRSSHTEHIHTLQSVVDRSRCSMSVKPKQTDDGDTIVNDWSPSSFLPCRMFVFHFISNCRNNTITDCPY